MGVFDRPNNNIYGKNKMNNNSNNNNRTNSAQPRFPKPKAKSSIFGIVDRLLERPPGGGVVDGKEIGPQSTLTENVLKMVTAALSASPELFMDDDGNISAPIVKNYTMQITKAMYAAMEGIVEIKMVWTQEQLNKNI